VYRLLTKKAKKYKAHDLEAPLIVCVGSERSSAVRITGGQSVSAETAVREACRRCPVLSAVIIVSIEPSIPTLGASNPTRRARVTALSNADATYPLNGPLLNLDLRFDRVDYGHGWNEWEGIRSAVRRIERLSGHLVWEKTPDGFALTLPAHEVLQVLGGRWSAADLQKSYQLTDSGNPFRQALEEGRQIVAVELVPHDARGHEPQMIRITLGPATPLLLQTPRNLKQP
jgi:hypothetical protein